MLNGLTRDRHYYLGTHGAYTHGAYKEVSQTVWERLRFHELSVWFSLPLAPSCTWYWMVGHTFPWLMGLRQGGAVKERVRAVQASSVRLASGRCGGNINGDSVGGPFFRIEVFNDGLIMRPFPLRPVAILKTELTCVEGSTGLVDRGVRVSHASPDIGSPNLLYISPQGNLAEALHGLAARAETRV